MQALDIDAERRTAWAETGLTAGEYTAAAGAHGLATGFGDTGSVGIGGITLGGGVGFLVRKYGLTIDDLLAAEVVTADGQLLRADAETHPDLFWAIRGGGGNFGVATRFQFRLHEVDTIVGGMLMLPATPEVIAAFVAEAEAAPEELSTIANVMPAPPLPFVPAEHHGRLVVMAMLAYAGAVEAGERAIAPFRALATPIADMVRPMPLPGDLPAGARSGYHPVARCRARCSSTPSIAARRRRSSTTSRPRPRRCAVAQLRVLGGAMARVPADATAFAHRGQPDHGERRRGLRAARGGGGARGLGRPASRRRCAEGDAGAYVNFLGDEGEARVREAYPGSTWDRLRGDQGAATTRPTSSGSTRTSPPPQVAPTARSRLRGTGTSEPGSYTAVHRHATGAQMATTLVLGGTGKTGRRIVQLLQAAGRPVRVGTPSATPPFDWTDKATWPAALDGVGSVYVTYYPDLAIPGAAAAAGAFAELAVATGARRLVLLSGRGEEGARRGEQALRDAGADWTIVRSAFMPRTSTRASSWSRCGPARSPSRPTRT